MWFKFSTFSNYLSPGKKRLIPGQEMRGDKVFLRKHIHRIELILYLIVPWLTDLKKRMVLLSMVLKANKFFFKNLKEVIKKLKKSYFDYKNFNSII